MTDPGQMSPTPQTVQGTEGNILPFCVYCQKGFPLYIMLHLTILKTNIP